jgi:hypothetical protein
MCWFIVWVFNRVNAYRDKKSGVFGLRFFVRRCGK